jgi:predicted DNA-binding protein (UPF0251 family)
MPRVFRMIVREPQVRRSKPMMHRSMMLDKVMLDTDVQQQSGRWA